MTSMPPPTIKSIGTMSSKNEELAVQKATEALKFCQTEKEMASYVKKEFDRLLTPTWHVFVGRNFGSYVTHETENYIYFYIGQMGFLIFKSG
jgi:dynein light chain LC8-type